MSGLVAIHQPNFFPWLGYFDKIRRADTFIFLDAVDYPRSGSGGMGSWVNRVRLNIQGEARWVTAPLSRMPLGSKITEARIDDRQAWRDKLLKTIEFNYRRAPHFEACMTLIRPLIENPENNLANFNIHVIKTVAELFRFETRFVRQSQLAFSGQATDLLISLVRAVDGDAYLAGGGAAGYQDDDAFSRHGLACVSQGFTAKPYGNCGSFISGLSVVDFLMHVDLSNFPQPHTAGAGHAAGPEKRP